MLQALLTSALAGLKADMAAQAQRAGTMIALVFVALLFVFVALGAFATAAIFALEPHVGLAGAAAIVGAVAVVLALIFVLIGTWRRPAPRSRAMDEASRAVDEASRAVSDASAAAEKSLAEFAGLASKASVPVLLSALALGVMFGSKPKRRRK